MTFVCQCCGECCSTMGEIISIREQIRPYEFRIQYTDGEERLVNVDPDKRDLFREQQQNKKSIACPFLRQLAPHKHICTVHDSRPELCRIYLCSRILILNKEGNKAGWVQYGTRSFTTEDTTLLDLWDRSIRDIPVPEDEQWEKKERTSSPGQDTGSSGKWQDRIKECGRLSETIPLTAGCRR